MEGKYLVINAGSSSLKFSLYEMPEAKELVNGLVEKIGEGDSRFILRFNDNKIEDFCNANNHIDAVNIMLNGLTKNNFISNIDEIKGIGHRVLHGGEKYNDSVVIDENVINDIKKLTKLGPLHHPGQIAGIESMKLILPNVLQVAVFDTAFHQTMPEENYLYAVPYDWYEKNGVRKYGFHGTSHKYITECLKKRYSKDNVNAIICHIGSGASISCIKEGKCYDTSMGLTPLDGLIMGTRSGSIDPSIIEYISNERNLNVQEINPILNKNSGLIGIAGKNDFRDLTALAESGNRKAQLAILMMRKSIIKYIAQYYFELNGNVDAIVFTAGIGENRVELREKIIEDISKPMGISLNKEANDNISRSKANRSGKISTDNSKIEVLVIPTDEEYIILKDTYNLSKTVTIENSKVLKNILK